MSIIKKLSFRTIVSPVLAVALVVGMGGFSFVDIAQAASLTTVSDTVTNHNASATTSNVISFVTVGTIPAGVTGVNGGQIKFDFGGGTVSPTIGTITTGDVALTVGGVTQTFATIAAGSATAGAATWGIASTGTTITLAAPTLMTTIPTATTIVFSIGTAAGGTNRITNGAVGTEILTISTKSNATTTIDTGLVAMPIIANDQVVVTATVNPTLSFSLTQVGAGLNGTASNAVDFGALDSTQAKYAKNGASSGGYTVVTTQAIDANIATNAVNGYTINYLAPTTLTNGVQSLTAATIDCGITNETSACTTGPNSGWVGHSQFAMSGIVVTNGSTGSAPAVTTSYLYNASPASPTPHTHWNFAPGTSPVTLVTGSAPTTTDTVGLRFLANIPATQAPGTYTVSITYIATGNF